MSKDFQIESSIASFPKLNRQRLFAQPYIDIDDLLKMSPFGSIHKARLRAKGIYKDLLYPEYSRFRLHSIYVGLAFSIDGITGRGLDDLDIIKGEYPSAIDNEFTAYQRRLLEQQPYLRVLARFRSHDLALFVRVVESILIIYLGSVLDKPPTYDSFPTELLDLRTCGTCQ